MINHIIQTAIALTAGLAIWLTQQPDQELARYASIVGLIGQPFWFYTSFKAKQWGIFALTWFYTYAWLVGFYNFWVIN